MAIDLKTVLVAGTLSLEGLCLVLELEVVWLAIDTTLVNDGDTLEGEEEVLGLAGNAVPVSSSKVVEVRYLLEDEVYHSHDDGDTKRVGPDTNDGDDVGPVLVVRAASSVRVDILGAVTSGDEPAEERKHGREDIDNQDGAGELERGPGEGGLYSRDDCMKRRV